MKRPDRVFWLVIALALLLGYVIAFCEPEVRTITELTPSPTLRVAVIPERSPILPATNTPTTVPTVPEMIVAPAPTSTSSPTPTMTPRPTETPVRTPVQRGMR